MARMRIGAALFVGDDLHSARALECFRELSSANPNMSIPDLTSHIAFSLSSHLAPS
jgi:hypothetical protein